MANTYKIYTGAGHIQDGDYLYVKFVGSTKSGSPIKIELLRALPTSNINLSFVEKNEVVPEFVFEGVYQDDKLAAGDRTEPWKMTCQEGLDANGQIVARSGTLYLGTTDEDAQPAGLLRGGCVFSVERNIRAINADDDPGLVEGRVDYDEAKPKLTAKSLQWLSNFKRFYAGIKEVPNAEAPSA